MMVRCVTVLLLVVTVLCWPLSTHSKPMGGKIDRTIKSLNSSASGLCHMMGLYEGSTIDIGGHFDMIGGKGKADPKPVNLSVTFKLYKLHCANYLGEEEAKLCRTNGISREPGLVDPVITPNVYTRRNFKGATESGFATFHFYENTSTKPATTELDAPPNNTNSTPANPSVKKNEPSQNSIKRSKEVAKTINESGIYLLQVYVEQNNSLGASPVEVSVHIEMHNPHGFLSAIDYPALVFYGIMTSVYAVYAIVWIVMMLCSFNDLVRLQFWILAVIILGFLEKTFFVAEYSAINLGNENTYGFYIIAEFVSAVKRGLSRMLLIIVAMGFGTVKPRLGDSLIKVVAAGVAYFFLALVDGIMRYRTSTFHTNDTSSVVTLALLLLLDTFIFYWIFTAIVDTRRTLRLRKNYFKLSMYNHFAYTLIFAILATIGFTIWVFVDLEYPPHLCLTDWREVWLRDCFWHVLFAFILIIVMVIWRPSSNRSRFTYSLVTDPDDEDEIVFEQGNNKNFDTVKMRATSKLGSSSEPPPPPVTSQAEDDLRWVEENLPTTAMDKALPLILDSDEEVMTTKFEVSKMN